jgi:hypothetical protein
VFIIDPVFYHIYLFYCIFPFLFLWRFGLSGIVFYFNQDLYKSQSTRHIIERVLRKIPNFGVYISKHPVLSLMCKSELGFSLFYIPSSVLSILRRLLEVHCDMVLTGELYFINNKNRGIVYMERTRCKKNILVECV